MALDHLSFLLPSLQTGRRSSSPAWQPSRRPRMWQEVSRSTSPSRPKYACSITARTLSTARRLSSWLTLSGSLARKHQAASRIAMLACWPRSSLSWCRRWGERRAGGVFSVGGRECGGKLRGASGGADEGLIAVGGVSRRRMCSSHSMSLKMYRWGAHLPLEKSRNAHSA